MDSRLPQDCLGEVCSTRLNCNVVGSTLLSVSSLRQGSQNRPKMLQPCVILLERTVSTVPIDATICIVVEKDEQSIEILRQQKLKTPAAMWIDTESQTGTYLLMDLNAGDLTMATCANLVLFAESKIFHSFSSGLDQEF